MPDHTRNDYLCTIETKHNDIKHYFTLRITEGNNCFSFVLLVYYIAIDLSTSIFFVLKVHLDCLLGGILTKSSY